MRLDEFFMTVMWALFGASFLLMVADGALRLWRKSIRA